MAAQARPTVGRRLLATALGVVPGLAHVLVLDRPGTGTLLFLLFLGGAQAAAWGRYLVEAEWASDLLVGGSVAAAAAWLLSFLDVARITLFRNYEKRAALRAKLADEGVRFYAAGRLEKARRAFREALALDLRDADILFWYGCVEARRGKPKRARRSFRRCRKYDRAGKWTFQVGREEERLAGGPPAADGG